MSEFEGTYKKLNAAQRKAVDVIDGPLLVIAGPGTGKTQLLSARVANILQKTDTLPRNILCLTFTESGAQNMRERLTRFIGQAAYDVQISTYHGFGSDIIQRFPEYFTATQLQNPADQLIKHEILRGIIDNLSYTSPLKQLRHHIGDLVSTVSELKRALITPEQLRAIANENLAFVNSASQACGTSLKELSSMARISAAATPLFEDILASIRALEPQKPVHHKYGTLCGAAIQLLESALSDASEQKSTKPITAWKNAWLSKNENNLFVFSGELENRRISTLADVFEEYEQALSHRGLYDFDDMISRSIEALQNHSDLKYTLQEQYLYVLLDEFQDTNAAQLELVKLLSDNPVHENRPNVMAVGDDDQAIYAFQGAEYSNMYDFYTMFRDVEVINLTENYRSQDEILTAARNVAEQIDARLQSHFPQMTKALTPSGAFTNPARLKRIELSSDVAQYDWIASQIKQLIDDGTEPSEIAVLAPKHRYLEPLVGHLNALEIPVQYEKRENILETPIIIELLTMVRLVLAIKQGDRDTSNALWPEVLSYNFWQIPVRTIWEQSWEIADDKESEPNWTRALLGNPRFSEIAQLFSALALKANTETCETMLDYLIGSQPVNTHDIDLPEVSSKLRSFYTSPEMQTSHPEVLFETMTQLKVLQTKLRDHQATQNRTLLLGDLLEYVEMYEAADEQMLNTSPYHQQANAVQLMTVFKAKGLEFEHVFLPSCHDDVWGEGSRGNRNNLTLPENLQPIRHAGTTDDERLRIFFVAITRAKSGLYLTSFSRTYSGKSAKRLKYLDEREQDDGSFRSNILPQSSAAVEEDGREAPSLESLEIHWQTKHYTALSDITMHGLLQHRLDRYQLSPTHLGTFTDLHYGGPQAFLFSSLLRFPSAPTVAGQYGNAIHETLEWVQHFVSKNSSLPSIDIVHTQFARYIEAKHLSDIEQKLQTEKGKAALTAWLGKRGDIFTPQDIAERNFRNEGVFIGEAHMSGKIDRLEVDRKTRKITVVDYKTGRPHQKWSNNDLNLHKYRQQLICYKLLIEGSHSFEGYEVTKGRLEFIEPDERGVITSPLELSFDKEEVARIASLIKIVWKHIKTLSIPDVSEYSSDIKGTLQFEEVLLSESD